jgi:hypothetical protein
MHLHCRLIVFDPCDACNLTKAINVYERKERFARPKFIRAGPYSQRHSYFVRNVNRKFKNVCHSLLFTCFLLISHLVRFFLYGVINSADISNLKYNEKMCLRFPTNSPYQLHRETNYTCEEIGQLFYRIVSRAKKNILKNIGHFLGYGFLRLLLI